MVFRLSARYKSFEDFQFHFENGKGNRILPTIKHAFLSLCLCCRSCKKSSKDNQSRVTYLAKVSLRLKSRLKE